MNVMIKSEAGNPAEDTAGTRQRRVRPGPEAIKNSKAPGVELPGFIFAGLNDPLNRPTNTTLVIYLALLRGINVGGNNKVEMKKLKAALEARGFKNVVTYINSGNIVFESLSKKRDMIANKIEKAIKSGFKLDIQVSVRNFKEMETICRKLPKTWVKNAEMRTDILFLQEEVDQPNIIRQLQINPVDTVKYIPGALLWNVTGKNYSKSGMLKLLGTEAYKNMTIRNVTTVRKLFQVMAEMYDRKKTGNS